MKTLEHVSDTELIRSFQEGDTEAFEVLIYRYKDKIYSSILFFVKDNYLAEDLFQDVFIKIIDTLKNKRYTEEGKFLPWALRIAHNLSKLATIKTFSIRSIFMKMEQIRRSCKVRVMIE